MKEREERITWNELFKQIALLVAKRSADPHTQVGSVIVKDNRILAIGYNGCPSTFNFDFDWTTDEKYKYCVHSEANALANAARVGANVNGADIYVTMSPCFECIKLLIQAGIKTVYYIDTYKDFEITKTIVENTKTIKLVNIK
ncbi:MAG: dCMP deaminase family protein [Bacilli bacterium]|nr:dCMP deaminase family protein [Bacilli bacterium]